MTSIIDMTAFENLKSMAGADFIGELIVTFLDDAPQMIQQMRSSLAANDAETFRRAAHSLKSNAAVFGAVALHAVEKELERLTRPGTLAGAEPLVLKGEREFARAKASLEQSAGYRRA